MRNLLIPLVVAAGLLGCGPTIRPDKTGTAEVIPVENPYELFHSCQSKLLRDLRDASARADCELAVKLRPAAEAEYNPQLLLDQLDVEPVNYLNSDRAAVPTHRVRTGEDLMQVAARELGNGFLFVALARHNCIDKPSDAGLEGRVLDLTGASHCDGRQVLSTARNYLHSCRQLLLRDIHSGEARANCERAAATSTHNRDALLLLRQLNEDPATLLPGGAIEYAVRFGDSLGQLARTYLGDELLFVALARYNQISDPSLLSVGQILWIPGAEVTDSGATPPDEPPVSAEPLERGPDVLQLARADATRRFEQGDFAGVIVILTDTPGLVLDTEMTEMQGEARRQLRIEEYLAGAAQAETDGDPWAAYESYSNVLTEDPDHRAAGSKAAQLKRDLIKDYEKDAARHFSNQRYEETVVLCDRIFELDADNTVAGYYKDQAVIILERLGN